MTEQTWRDYDEWWVQAGTTGNDYFHASKDCRKIRQPEKATQRSENYMAFHEPEPCDSCHPELGDKSSEDVTISHVSGDTTIFEMREMARDDILNQPIKHLITPGGVDEHPHRNYDVLKRVLESYDSTNKMSKALGTDHRTVRRWALIYGLEYPGNEPSKIRHRNRVLGDD